MQGRKKVVKALVILTIFLLCVFISFMILAGTWPYKPPPIIICNVNVRSLGICCLVYHKENESWPDKDKWCDLLKPYFEGYKENVLLCPADKIGPCSYAMNENIPADVNELPCDLVLLFESAPRWNRVGGVNDVVTDRHKPPGANIAFADGHVEFVKIEDIPKLRWTVEE